LREGRPVDTAPIAGGDEDGDDAAEEEENEEEVGEADGAPGTVERDTERRDVVTARRLTVPGDASGLVPGKTPGGEDESDGGWRTLGMRRIHLYRDVRRSET